MWQGSLADWPSYVAGGDGIACHALLSADLKKISTFFQATFIVFPQGA